MKNTIKELWHGNIVPQEDSRTNSTEMKELLGYISRHYADLEKALPMSRKKYSKNSTIAGVSMRA